MSEKRVEVFFSPEEQALISTLVIVGLAKTNSREGRGILGAEFYQKIIADAEALVDRFNEEVFADIANKLWTRQEVEELLDKKEAKKIIENILSEGKKDAEVDA